MGGAGLEGGAGIGGLPCGGSSFPADPTSQEQERARKSWGSKGADRVCWPNLAEIQSRGCQPNPALAQPRGSPGDLGRGGRDPEPGKSICLGTHPRAPWVWPRDGKPHRKMLLPEDCGGGIIAALKRRERQSEDLGWPGTGTRGRGRSARMTRVTYGFARLQGRGCGEESGLSSWSRGAASASAQRGVRGAAEAPGLWGQAGLTPPLPAVRQPGPWPYHIPPGNSEVRGPP